MKTIFEQTTKLCKEHNIKPQRSKGQNFLIEEDIYDQIIEAADLKNDDAVLEVGPGLGFLTERLAKKAKKVIAVELDDKLAVILGKRLEEQGIGNVEVVNENILDISHITYRISQNYKVVANLPYNITSVFLRKFLSGEHKPDSMVLMLQKEVAERIVAKPGKPRQGRGKMSLLAVSVQFYAEAEIVGYVGKEYFWPSPEVDSAIIKLQISNDEFRIKKDEEKEFFRLVKIGFAAKRKMLKNNLASGFNISQKEASEILAKAGFDEKIRAQNLSVDDWVKIFGFF